MDLETENRIAAILLKEAAELRRQAQKEGALAYLHQPTVRSRPNSRFLTATVRGVQQANRAVEVSEMWRLREKQLELDNRLKGVRNESSSGRSYTNFCESRRSTSRGYIEVETGASTSFSSKKRSVQDFGPSKEDEGLRDDEVDEFLHSRTKRGRGAVGSRMDETGPYLPCSADSTRNVLESDTEEVKKARVLLGPEKPHSMRSGEESSDDESDQDRKKKAKASKRHSRKHKSKEKSKDKKKKRRKEKRNKYHK